MVSDTDPEKVVMSLSLQKAGDVAQKLKNQGRMTDIVVIGADTVVAAGGQILGKPRDKHDAARMIKKPAGRRHQVYTGVYLYCIGQVWGMLLLFMRKPM